MALIAAQVMTNAGLTPTFVAAGSSGDTIAAADVQSGGCYIEIKNSGSSTTATLADPGYSAAGNAGTATAVTVPATTGHIRVPILTAHVSPSTGVASITYAVATNLTVAVVRR